jgi:lipid-A-disaccharide synthase-like uncharacterized protein
VSPVVFWLTVGFAGQILFTARFLVQWLASERKGTSVVPVEFWWLSLLGGVAVLCYALSRRDPVIITGQSLGLFVYARNLILLRQARRHHASTGDSGSTYRFASARGRPSSASTASPMFGARMSDSPTRMAAMPAARSRSTS